MRKYLLFICLIALVSCKKSSTEPQPEQPKNEVTINGNVFKTVEIGTQVWTSEGYKGNTSATIYKDGSWGYTANQIKAIVPPAGWRIPSKADVEKLFRFAGATGEWVALQETYTEAKTGEAAITVTDNGTQFIARNATAVKFIKGNEWEFASATNSLGFNAEPLDNKTMEFWCSDQGMATFIFYTTVSDKAIGAIKHLPNINQQYSKYLYKKAGVRFVKDK